MTIGGTAAAGLAAVAATLLLGLEPGRAGHRGDLVVGAAAAADPGDGVRRVVPAVAVVLTGAPTTTPAPRRGAARPRHGLRGRVGGGIVRLVGLGRVGALGCRRLAARLAATAAAATAATARGGLRSRRRPRRRTGVGLGFGGSGRGLGPRRLSPAVSAEAAALATYDGGAWWSCLGCLEERDAADGSDGDVASARLRRVGGRSPVSASRQARRSSWWPACGWWSSSRRRVAGLVSVARGPATRRRTRRWRRPSWSSACAALSSSPAACRPLRVRSRPGRARGDSAAGAAAFLVVRLRGAAFFVAGGASPAAGGGVGGGGTVLLIVEHVAPRPGRCAQPRTCLTPTARVVRADGAKPSVAATPSAGASRVRHVTDRGRKPSGRVAVTNSARPRRGPVTTGSTVPGHDRAGENVVGSPGAASRTFDHVEYRTREHPIPSLSSG